jgi:hypothetical protein
LQSSTGGETKDILILATSKAGHGVCVVGMVPETGAWVRPVRSAASHAERFPLTVQHVKAGIDVLYKNLHLTRVPLIKPSPVPPYIEDWLLDPTRRPKTLRALNEDQARRFLDSRSDGRLPELLTGQTRSLCLLKPESYELEAEMVGTDLRVRISFVHQGVLYKRMTCNDLKLRSFARIFLKIGQTNHAKLKREDFERAPNAGVYLVVGLTRREQGKLWPAVLAFHTVPAYPGEINWETL